MALFLCGYVSSLRRRQRDFPYALNTHRRILLGDVRAKTSRQTTFHGVNMGESRVVGTALIIATGSKRSDEAGQILSVVMIQPNNNELTQRAAYKVLYADGTVEIVDSAEPHKFVLESNTRHKTVLKQ